MSTQKTKKHYYVLVITLDGPMFVTGTGEGHTAFWNREEKPKEYSKNYAESIVFGLNLNFHLAYLIVADYEIPSQPYNYKDYNFIATKKSDKDI